MALFHRATITPTKAELIADWAPTQPWGPPPTDPIEVIGSYRFDDPDGRVGMETHLVTAGDTLLQVPLTYRDEPLDGADEPSSPRWSTPCSAPAGSTTGSRDPLLVVDARGGRDDRPGRGARHGGVRRPLVRRAEQRPHPGRGWTQERVPVDGFASHPTTRRRRAPNDRFELTVFRRPVTGPRPAIGLTADWDGQEPVVLTEVRERLRPARVGDSVRRTGEAVARRDQYALPVEVADPRQGHALEQRAAGVRRDVEHPRGRARSPRQAQAREAIAPGAQADRAPGRGLEHRQLAEVVAGRERGDATSGAEDGGAPCDDHVQGVAGVA